MIVTFSIVLKHYGGIKGIVVYPRIEEIPIGLFSKNGSIDMPEISLSKHEGQCMVKIDNFYTHDDHASLWDSGDSVNQYVNRILNDLSKELEKRNVKYEIEDDKDALNKIIGEFLY